MRPHTVAAIAVLLYFLQNKAARYYFYVEMMVKKNGKDVQRKEYDMNVLLASEDHYIIRIGRMWTCELEIKRYKAGENKFYIRHNHSEWITEDVNIFSNRIEGKYNGHRTYKDFESNSYPRPDNLELRSSYTPYSYEMKSIK